MIVSIIGWIALVMFVINLIRLNNNNYRYSDDLIAAAIFITAASICFK